MKLLVAVRHQKVKITFAAYFQKLEQHLEVEISRSKGNNDTEVTKLTSKIKQLKSENYKIKNDF